MNVDDREWNLNQLLFVDDTAHSEEGMNQLIEGF